MSCRLNVASKYYTDQSLVQIEQTLKVNTLLKVVEIVLKRNETSKNVVKRNVLKKHSFKQSNSVNEFCPFFFFHAKKTSPKTAQF